MPGPGTFTTGPFNISTRTTLTIEADAVVKGSTDVAEYTIIAPLPSYGSARDGSPPGCPKDGCHTRFQALVMVPPGSTDVILNGPGTLHGAHLSGERVTKEIMKASGGVDATTENADSNH